MKINSTMKMRVKHIAMILTLLLLGSMVNEAWAAYKVTYHILTLPMSSSTYNIKSEYSGKRMEAIRVIVNNATTIELPAHFKSPLATDFKYYEASQVTKSAAAENLYDNGSNKGYLYDLNATPTPIAEGSAVNSNRDIYVTYTYNEASNTIAKLDGSVDYNIVISGGFLSLNRGRNNRPAVFPTAKVSASDLISDDFVKVAVNGTNISAYWNDANLNKNKRADVESNFHFLFKFIGGDPYNIIVSTAYSKNTTYIEAYNNEPQLYKRYKDAHLLAKSTDNAFLASDDHILYTMNWNSSLETNPTEITSTDKKGYFHSLSAPVWNTVALLNNTTNTGFVFMGTRCADTNGNIRDPNDNKYYYLQNANNNNLKFGLTTAADASNKYSTEEKKVYPIKTVNFKVTTSFYSVEPTDAHIVTATTRLSEYTIDHDPIDEKFIPEELKRKYCTFTKFYKDAAHTQEITKFTDAKNGTTGEYDVYVDYEVSASAPFKCIEPAATYSAATWTAASWYELTDKDEATNKKIKYDGSANFKNNGVTATYEKVSEYGFIGDPYELRVILRSATAGTTPHYVGAAGTPETGTQLTTTTPASDAAGFKWEIPYDATDGSMLLRLYKGTGHWYWDTTGSNQNVTYSTASSTRVKVLELPKFTYTYNMVDNTGRIAIKATAVQTIFTPISGYASIPEDIRSPFLADEDITYYDDNYVDGSGRESLTHSITETPGTADDIFVSYTTTQLSSKSIKLDNETFNVKLNDEYIYWDGSKIVSKADPTSGELASNAYLWRLPGGDPYAMKIYNMGNTKFVKKDGDSWGNDKALLFDATEANASLFIAMMGNYTGVYEVLAATGTTDLYHIGRASTTGAETKIYSIDTKNGGYAHGADQLRFELAGQTLITYTLVDKAKTDLLTVTSNNPRLALPSEYQSPLVATYYYYKTREDAITDNKSNNITEIAQDGDNHVWVTYTVNDLVSFNTTSSTRNNPYLLRFHDGESYYMEDGADKLTTGDKIQAMYPYCNGDGNLNIYGERMRNEQMNGGTSTRSRWQWFFESANSDPYHVKIHSYNKITMPGGGQDFTYLHTSAEHFDQEPADKPNKKRIVTGTTLPGSGVPATEYMILGTAGHYKLLTTDPVAADLDGDGNTTGSGENERQYVTSFEQYWKTYNMVKQYLLELGEDTDEPSTNPSTFVMPSEKWSDLKTALTAKGINDNTDPNYLDGSNWHSYSNVASAIRWNGYNNDGTHKSRVVEELEHWFQTFDMGDGTFDIEDGFIPPVLVLLDRHGWEIMRKPIPTGSGDTEADSKLAELRAFDSPMVKRYTFYSNAQKVSNCHKFEIRMQDGKERDTIKVNNVRFTSTSLAELPPYADNRDLFVTYTVKEEYEESYTYSLNYSESKDGSGKTVYTINSETGTPSAFIVLQNHQFATENGSSITPSSAPDNLSDEIISDAEKSEASKTFQRKSLWYLQPNLEIDDEMGIPWPWSTATNGENSHTKPETKVDYYKNKRTGFDPYNLQLKNVSTGKFFTIHMTQSRLDGGAYTGVYSGEGGSLNVTLAEACNSPISSPESYDHSTLQMTNQTFMAVQDENGNMQLMPRFDHSHRINAFTTLAEPLTHEKAEVDDASPGEQTTFLVRPLVFDYKVIDNQGRVALRYKMGGEYYPSMPDHFKSPLAEDFKFYKTAPVYNSGTKTLTVSDEITSSFAAAGVKESASIYIRYSYNDTYDTANQNILQGQWLTMSLGGKDVQATGTLSTADGTGISLYTGTKDATQPKWQWKFLQSQMASTSELYVAPDPYCVIISNREANNDNPTNTPSKMATAIKVSEKDRFVILTHPEGDYALLAAGDGLSSYSFLNGGSMTTDVAEPKTAASVEPEEFSKASNSISDDARIIFNEDVTHTYTYYIINNSQKLAASETQDDATAAGNEFKPVVPYNIQSPIINDEDYLYYGTAKISGDTYTIDSDVEKFIIDNLYGLFDDKVYVRYPAFSRDNTPYMVPNERNGSSPVAVGAGSNDVAIDINGNLPYNIIWHSDNMMSSSGGATISDGGNKGHQLSATNADMWHFEGSDPYAINIYNMHESDKKYITRTCSTCGGTGKVEEADCTFCSGKGWVSTCRLAASPTSFMLLKRDGYDYGVLAVTGEQTTMLSGYGNTTVTGGTTPTKFIPFALSVHHLIYHLVINTSKVNTNIPYREGNEDSYQTSGTWNSQVTPIPGTTQRDLTSTTTVTGDTYQLGETIYFKQDESTTISRTYCYDAGKVSLGDVLEVPVCFKRPNCRFYYYVQDIYDTFNNSYDGTKKRCETLDETLNNKYKGLKIEKLISKAELIGKTVVINVTYSFDVGLPTNAGDGFVTDKNDNLWYTFETNDATPYLAHYTNAWGLQSMEGRATRYTNDYLWKPLGDPYGFVMYNRYMMKNSSSDAVMTTTSFAENVKVKMATKDANAVYELLANESTTPGYFLVHPVVNNAGTQYYMKRNESSGDIDSDGHDDKDYAILSTTPTEWTFGLSPELIQPYLERVGYVGGLKKTAYDAMADDLVTAIQDGSATAAQLMTAQGIVYNDANIVGFTSGYYRLHNQPGVSNISPVRYASGYLHDIEKTAVSGGIPMHFYSRVNTNTTFAGDGGLGSGFTESDATRGDIPVLATEYDPSSIFYISGSINPSDPNDIINPRVTMSTQALYVKGDSDGENAGKAVMTDNPSSATTFSLMDIGGAVFLIHNGLTPTSREYFHFDQRSSIYDLKYFHNAPTDDAKWCLQPVQKSAMAGTNEMGLRVRTNNGGDNHYYATFCAPFDVLLTDAEKDVAYIVPSDGWPTIEAPSTAGVAKSKKIGLYNTEGNGCPASYRGKDQFIPAGTPAIIRTTSTEGYVTLALPTTTPSTSVTTALTGKYLEQILPTLITATDKVYAFGLPITGYNLTIDPADGFTNGEVNNVLEGSAPATTGVGFYLNANRNKEKSATSGQWTPNNRYVLHNKIYYRAGGSGAMTRGIDFVPVVFDDDAEDNEFSTGVSGIKEDGNGEDRKGYDNRVYDLQGRCVATEEQVKDGTWRMNVKPGIYIFNGKKVFVRR